MKSKRMLFVIFALLAAFALLAIAQTSKPNAGSNKMSNQEESPFACNVKALDNEQRQRWMQLLLKLNGAKQEMHELPDGYEFRFAAEAATIQEIAEFMNYERRCCPFFDLELVLARENGPLWLRFRGREGVKTFIRSEFKLP